MVNSKIFLTSYTWVESRTAKKLKKFPIFFVLIIKKKQTINRWEVVYQIRSLSYLLQSTLHQFECRSLKNIYTRNVENSGMKTKQKMIQKGIFNSKANNSTGTQITNFHTKKKIIWK